MSNIIAIAEIFKGFLAFGYTGGIPSIGSPSLEYRAKETIKALHKAGYDWARFDTHYGEKYSFVHLENTNTGKAVVTFFWGNKNAINFADYAWNHGPFNPEDPDDLATFEVLLGIVWPMLHPATQETLYYTAQERKICWGNHRWHMNVFFSEFVQSIDMDRALAPSRNLYKWAYNEEVTDDV